VRGDRGGLIGSGQDGFRGMWGYAAARFDGILRKLQHKKPKPEKQSRSTEKVRP